MTLTLGRNCLVFEFHNKPGWRNKSVEDAFSEKYVVVSDSGCWIWVASTFKTGYGQFNPRNGRIVTAHRFSYELHNGQIPSGMFVCHRCDVRSCVNPDHLFLGTCAENLADMRAKGRARHASRAGEKNPSAKLTVKQAREIYCSDRPRTELAAKYGITRQAVRNIKLRKSWREATEMFGL